MSSAADWAFYLLSVQHGGKKSCYYYAWCKRRYHLEFSCCCWIWCCRSKVHGTEYSCICRWIQTMVFFLQLSFSVYFFMHSAFYLILTTLIQCIHLFVFLWKFSYLYFSREEGLIERAKALKVNAGTEPGTDLGPVISKQVVSFRINLPFSS